MVEHFTACQLEIPEPTERERLVERLRREDAPLLVLNTCQRLEVYGWSEPEGLSSGQVREQWKARDALRRLARIVAGLDSRVLGELEVLGQVREAFRNFEDSHGNKDSRLSRLFQDALALGRRARRESGIDRNLTGLGALAARTVIERVPSDAPVAIVGSGSLARSVARYLGKRTRLPIRVASRCPENAMDLAMEVHGFSHGLDEFVPMMKGVHAIITATAAPHALLFPHHLLDAATPLLLIDLGEPPDCCASVREMDSVEYLGLLDIESMAQTNTAERAERGKLAARIIEEATERYCLR